MARPAILGILVIGFAGCGAEGTIGASPDESGSESEIRATTMPGDPLPGLTAAELELFNAGKEEFGNVEGVADGLGPVFNDVSCGACHNVPALGGGATRLVTRFGTLTNGVFDPLANLGGSLIQVNGIGAAGGCNFVGETVPPDANVTAGRRTTPLFGLGLVDAIPDSELHYIENYEASYFPNTAGHPAVVPNIAAGSNTLGKFGWKLQNPTLHQFSGDAYLNEMGITNPEFPNENCPQGNCELLACNPVKTLQDDGTDVQKFLDFMQMLAPPPRGPSTFQTQRGNALFIGIGCSSCHWANLTTGASPISALANKRFHPFSDFMLHDMGSLGDGITQNNATGRLMRTAPLWGASAQPAYLHDGRAHTIDEAISGHDGQGARARLLYQALPSGAKADLVAYVNSL
jgi:CxxC motif-containing protein (DUF1111 family)